MLPVHKVINRIIIQIVVSQQPVVFYLQDPVIMVCFVKDCRQEGNIEQILVIDTVHQFQTAQFIQMDRIKFPYNIIANCQISISYETKFT